MLRSRPLARHLPWLSLLLVFLLTPSLAWAQGLNFIEVHEDNQSPETGGTPTTETHLDNARGVTISPDGAHVYTISAGNDAVTVFSRNPTTGVLTLVEVQEDNESSEAGGSPTTQTHLDNVQHLVISPDGNHLYVNSAGDDALTVFSRNGTTGALTLVQVHADNESPEANGSPIAQTHLDGLSHLAISPDGAHVYATSSNDDAVTVFSRNGTTGALTRVQVQEDDDSPETNGSPIAQTHLNGARSLIVSHDGANVYVTANVDDAVTVFSRNGTTGALTLVGVQEDDASPETNGSPTTQTHLDGARGLAESSDGNHVYVSAIDDDALTVFSRNGATGALTLVEVHADDTSPETNGTPIPQTHLDSARGVQLNPDGTQLFVASSNDDAVTVFTRDETTGELTLDEIHADNESPEGDGSPTVQTHLDSPRYLTISADGLHLYVTSQADDAVSAFEVLVPLAVELATLEARVTDGNVHLQWATTSETNNLGFEVQHRDGAAFQPIGFVEGSGTSRKMQHYSYALDGLTPGLHQFRLKHIDADGTFDYSAVVEVDLPSQHGAYLSPAYPNPFAAQTEVTVSVPSQQPVHIAAYDLLGREVAVLHTGVLAAEQTHRFAFDAADYPAGMYVIRATGATFTQSRMVTLMAE